MVQGDQEDRRGVDGEAQQERVGQDVLVAVGRDVEERVEVAVRCAGGEEGASGEEQGQVGQRVEQPGRGVAGAQAVRWGQQEPVQRCRQRDRRVQELVGQGLTSRSRRPGCP